MSNSLFGDEHDIIDCEIHVFKCVSCQATIFSLPKDNALEVVSLDIVDDPSIYPKHCGEFMKLTGKRNMPFLSDLVIEQEKPVMVLLLVADSGIPVYSKKFVDNDILDELLISGFITAINNVIQEAFSTSGSLESIKHQEYNLIFKPSDSLIFCYIFTGSTRPAINKLGSFMDEVYNTPLVWKSLTKVSSNGRGIGYDDKLTIEAMIHRTILS
ncbi:MAG: hypothetical protein KAR35_00245 [Candidatus Heimdallarchaeota archaeon]|nr:hypothetical protein [Candidatus Heimdallarchaeota archaeon]MCK5047780.1 hypothetical protein [Candidatus Heimdallarchaeota archaeon]